MDRDCIKLLTDKEFLNPFSQVHFSIKACKHSSRSKGKHGKQLEEDTGVGLHDLFLCQPSEGHENPTCWLTFTEKAVTGAHTASQPYSSFNKDFFKGHCPCESIAISYFCTISSLPKQTSTMDSHSPVPSALQPLATTHVFSVCVQLPLLGLYCKWDQRVCGLHI